MSVKEVLERREPANMIANKWTTSDGSPTDSRNPADLDQVVGVVPDSTAADVDAAIAAAAAALPAWAATPGPVRGDILRRFNELIGESADELAQLMTREMGKPLAESVAEIGRARGELDYAAGEGTRLHGTSVPSRSPSQLVVTDLEPLGVIGAITPWNFPLVAPMRKIGPALVCGNTVVLKPAPATPLTALALATLARDAGVPDGVLNVVTGDGATVGARLVADPRVAGISFTGSTAVGRSIGEAVGGRLGKVQLELGGKNAAYIHSASNLEKAVAHITSAAIQTTGQRCTSISRVIVQDEIADEVVRLLTETYDGYVVGSGLDPATQVGPLVNQGQYDRVAGYVEQGVADGAERTTAPREVPDGLFYPPTVLDRVTPDMSVARDEIFGPVLSVLRVSGVDEAIAVTNDNEYGLAAVVFSESLEVAMHFSRSVSAGMVHVNHGTISQPHVPFGGVKNSGLGEFSIGFTAKDFFTQTKVTYLSPEVI